MTDKTNMNVALIGLNMTTVAFAKSVIYHSAHSRAKTRFPNIGGLEAKDIWFSSCVSIDSWAYDVVGEKLSTALYRGPDHWKTPDIIGQPAFESKIEMTGGNPNSALTKDDDIFGLMMGGQNPIVRKLSTKIEDDEYVLNEDNFRRLIQGKCHEDDEEFINEALKADFVLISLPDEGSTMVDGFDLVQITKILSDLGVPYYILAGTRDFDDYDAPVLHHGNLPYVGLMLRGAINDGFVTGLIGREFANQNMTVEHTSHHSQRLDGNRHNVSGFAEVTTFGGQSASVSFNFTYEASTALAADLFDVVRFIHVANQNNIQGCLEGVQRVYGMTTEPTTERDLQECEALATGNLMALGEFYRSENGKFIHK